MHPTAFEGAARLVDRDGSLTAPLLVAVAFGLYYPGVIRTEERFLAENFPPLPPLPQPRARLPPSLVGVVDETDVRLDACAFRRELLGAAAVVPFIAGIELIEALHQASWLPSYFLIP